MCVRVSFTHIGPKFHGRKSSLATRPRNPSRSDSDEEEARDETPSSQVVGPGNAAKKTGSDRRRYPSCVAHGHVGAGMRALVPGPFPKVRHTAARSSQTSPSLRNSTGLTVYHVFRTRETGSAHDHRVEGHRIRYDDDTIPAPTWFLSYLIPSYPPPLTTIAILRFRSLH